MRTKLEKIEDRRTLLQKARAIPIHGGRPSPYTSEQLKLAIAWLNSQVTTNQCCVVTGFADTNGSRNRWQSQVASWIKQAIQKGDLEIKG